MSEPIDDKTSIQAWSMITAVAPGKFIISGEYSVVFGRPAIATAVDVKTTVTITPGSDGKVKLNLKDLACSLEWMSSDLKLCRLLGSSTSNLKFDVELVRILETSIIPLTSYRYHDNSRSNQGSIRDSAIGFLLIYIGINDAFGSSDRRCLDVTVKSAIPVGAGLGSSSAYSVSLIGAINKAHDEPLSIDCINDWAFNLDKYFHGKPSGVDNSTITHGGYILFQQGRIKGRIEQSSGVQVMLIDTKVSRSTKTMGEKLKIERESDASRTDNLFQDISQITEEIWDKMIEQGSTFDPRLIDKCLESNHKLLEQLGVGHERLSHIGQLAKQSGFVAKLTGAGCGGVAFILYKTDRDTAKIKELQSEFQKHDYATYLCTVGSQGLSVTINE